MAFEAEGFKTVGFAETDPYCAAILKRHWPDTPNLGDIKGLIDAPLPQFDILTAGYPCQPFSFAGQRRGTEDDRHLWPYISEIIAQQRPAWCVFENVYGHISLGLDAVLLDLEATGYASRAFVVPACGVDAPHRRDRVWIIARYVGDADGCGQSRHNWRSARQEPSDRHAALADANDTIECASGGAIRQKRGDDTGGGGQHVADTHDQRSQGGLSWRENPQRQGEHGYAGCRGAAHGQPVAAEWPVEPSVGRVAHGVSNRVDRLRALGNAIVPAVARRIALTIRKIEEGA